MPPRTIAVPLLVVPAVLAVAVWAAHSPVRLHDSPAGPDAAASIRAAAARIDALMEADWTDNGLTPAPEADELLVLRRLSLALHGTIPSLEEVRQFESDAAPDRLLRWTRRLLDDPRFGDYFSERLARGYVGVDTAPFLIFRRDRFKDWLAERLRDNAPYDALVRQIVSQEGLWTGEPAANFITSAVANDDIDENKLAGRTVRVFLGQRIDCAQCHNHPFTHWKQSEFEGLASFYGQTRVSVGGVEEKPREKGRPVEYMVEDRETQEKRTVPPAVPFRPEWLPADGTRRERLATWITHPDNRRFERAIVNRVWGYLFGRAWHDPVDDLPDPPGEANPESPPDLLDVLGRDFRENGCDLRRLILVIASSRAFRLASSHPTEDADEFDALTKTWGVFPVSRLRPEQVIGSMLQAASVQTIDQNSHLVTRITRFFRERDFVRDYGDLGVDELQEQPDTVTQALQRMNSNLSRDILRGSPFSATSRIASMASGDKACLDACFLIAVSRRPTDEESAELCPQLHGTKGERRVHTVEDLLWALFNSEEFAWNH